MLESCHSAVALNIYRRHASHCPGGRALHGMARRSSPQLEEVLLPDLYIWDAERSVQTKEHGTLFMDGGEGNRFELEAASSVADGIWRTGDCVRVISKPYAAGRRSARWTVSVQAHRPLASHL